jgi:hypothetical protein
MVGDIFIFHQPFLFIDKRIKINHNIKFWYLIFNKNSRLCVNLCGFAPLREIF